MHERSQLGRVGEDLVAAHYESLGYRVLARNWRCREGEIDLIVGRDRVVVFCEVKTRRGSGFGAPAEAVTVAKQRKLRTTALRWMAAHRGRYDTRFDVAAVTFDRHGRRIELITDAF